MPGITHDNGSQISKHRKCCARYDEKEYHEKQYFKFDGAYSARRCFLNDRQTVSILIEPWLVPYDMV